MELLELAGYKSSYIHMSDLVDHFFPPVRVGVRGGEAYTDLQYWKLPLPELSDESDEEEDVDEGDEVEDDEGEDDDTDEEEVDHDNAEEVRRFESSVTDFRMIWIWIWKWIWIRGYRGRMLAPRSRGEEGSKAGCMCSKSWHFVWCG